MCVAVVVGHGAACVSVCATCIASQRLTCVTLWVIFVCVLREGERERGGGGENKTSCACCDVHVVLP
jgi:hypothetical protein